jgi:hypothetical protein
MQTVPPAEERIYGEFKPDSRSGTCENINFPDNEARLFQVNLRLGLKVDSS